MSAEHRSDIEGVAVLGAPDAMTAAPPRTRRRGSRGSRGTREGRSTAASEAGKTIVALHGEVRA